MVVGSLVEISLLAILLYCVINSAHKYGFETFLARRDKCSE